MTMHDTEQGAVLPPRQIGRRWRRGAAAGLWFLGATAAAGAAELRDLYSDTWAAVDGLGRAVPAFDRTEAPRTHRTVGIFYFLWMDARKGPVHDLSKLRGADPAHPAYGPPGAFHWWGEPLFGYYRSRDPWVIRKHAQMLANAGVDVVLFDVTNALTYDETFLELGRVYEAMRAAGVRTPRFAFFTHSRSGEVAQRLYERYYAQGRHRDLWFAWKGRPLILARHDEASPEVKAFFTVRESWAWSKGHTWYADGRDRWPWLDHTPQGYGWHEDPVRPEAMPVCVAEHPVSNIGRSFHDGRQPPPEQQAPERGLYFTEQAKHALQTAPEFLWVTGWNEWIAQRFVTEKGGQPFLGHPLPAGGTYFVDAYSQEFSRDIEPMKGGHLDNYYYQMAALVRLYKGARPVPPVRSAAVSIDGRFEDWAGVGPEFRDAMDDPVQRDHPGYGDTPPYVNRTGRNDLLVAKVGLGEREVFFYVRAAGPLSPVSDPHWMQLFIDTDAKAATGWLGYDVMVGRTGRDGAVAALRPHAGSGFQWGLPVGVTCHVAGAEMELAIPFSTLGWKSPPPEFQFKWADHIPPSGDVADFYLNGDTAPDDRFNYRAVLR